LPGSSALSTDLSTGQTPEGKLDFHACRVAHDTIVQESGATVKEAMTHMRHATPNLTMNTCARTRNDWLAELAEAVGNTIISGSDYAQCRTRLEQGQRA
jgi:hypothetical protein